MFKGLKKYVLEFLMIFLAVVMGFIAENFRENISERAKEREYVRWIIKDMQTDTVILHRNLRKCKSVISAVDSITLLLSKIEKGQEVNAASLYKVIITASFLNDFHKYAVTQLRNSEHAGLIQSLRVNDLIARFEYSDSRKTAKEKFIDLQREKIIDLGARVFNSRKWDYISSPQEQALFVVDNGEPMNQFIGYLRFQKYLLNDLLQMYQLEQVRFESAIQTIADEYSIAKEDIDEIWDLAVKNSLVR